MDTINAPQVKPSFFVRLFASGMFTGYSPIVSGTVGSAAALVLYWLIPPLADWRVLLPLAAVTVLLGIPASSSMERYYGNDPSEVVIDEWAGMWISLLFLPKSWPIALIAFFLFRALDIFKLWPASYFDSQRGGFGIMMDDVAAGVYANLVLQLLVLLFPLLGTT